ncbi:MAG: hypothetical protein DMG64_02900 [Acidobacteria bacterium]|nr:MAG: hypothetical protein DMG64_02900 [Acidobacteriota bacterium]
MKERAMPEAIVLSTKSDELRSYTPREVAIIFFRHRRVATLCFLGMFFGAVLAALILPSYHAEMKFLVKRERVDPVISGDQSTSQIQIASPEITEQEMNSEVELLTSEDLLRQVVLANHLEQSVGSSWFHKNDQERKIAIAVRQLRSHLQVEAVRKTNIVNVTLSSSNAKKAADVLSSLANLYLEKHTQVMRPGGQYLFFAQQTEQAKKELTEAEEKLQEFNRSQQVVAPETERDNALEKLSELNLSFEQTRAAIGETEDRLDALKRLQRSMPARITTQLRQGDNPQLMQQLKSTLLNLQLKRTELLTKFQPTYPLVQEVDRQIAETQTAIDAENARPVREETTDQNPTEAWVRGELAKANADLSGLRAREEEQRTSVPSRTTCCISENARNRVSRTRWTAAASSMWRSRKNHSCRRFPRVPEAGICWSEPFSRYSLPGAPPSGPSTSTTASERRTKSAASFACPSSPRFPTVLLSAWKRLCRRTLSPDRRWRDAARVLPSPRTAVRRDP